MSDTQPSGSRVVCRAWILVYLDGKAEYEWACQEEAGHPGPHLEGRYSWSA